MPAVTDPKYYEVVEATWPCLRKDRLGPVTLRVGGGGGSRVSAATAEGDLSDAQVSEAETAMAALKQPRLFMIRDGERDLDAQLDRLGYEVMDPVVLWTCPPALLTDVEIPRVTTFCIWPPLAIQREIWETGGIGPERLAIMERSDVAKTSLLGRWDDKPAGTAYVAIHNGVAMLHALEILPHQRRKGMGVWIMRQAARWAAAEGARELVVLCTRANTGANALYARLGMTPAGGYHYRIKR
ncbi:GNAT family N-acetyltransferase [Phaeobacter sp. B1627]|uniref:GNAT family N-acetyltransferase n=1 Tax=Phaeobacter sp. B1627 TaxID=2583809 RepID=UPI00111BC3C9|nr:GNAT family N-acetyltransferase [Phaeobacter sp. B1627]TNJ47843.1 GNAT family N-acetyltransferase [Phaeobacter sp. B1627]